MMTIYHLNDTLAFVLNFIKGEIVMKQLLSILFLVLTPVMLFAVDVTFVVEGMKNDSGSVSVGIYNSKETFPKNGKHVTGCISKNKLSGKSVVIICKIDSGTYAAAAFHDENNNGELDKNFLGIPKESYGFSNNAKGTFGPPDFKDASFEVGSENIELNIRVQ
jgi:uncharacterized protein (DUF2141 family)